MICQILHVEEKEKFGTLRSQITVTYPLPNHIYIHLYLPNTSRGTSAKEKKILFSSITENRTIGGFRLSSAMDATLASNHQPYL